MARGKGRGGHQPPARPAPVSGPGALSQRTDSAQPVRTPTGGPYGSATDLRNMQQAAPIPQAGPTPPPAPGGGGRPSVPPGDPFRPTERPGEPGTAGIPYGAGPSGFPQMIADDPDLLIRVHMERLASAGFYGAAARLAEYLRRG